MLDRNVHVHVVTSILNITDEELEIAEKIIEVNEIAVEAWQHWRPRTW
jgi:hypothetical protein